ncbi:DUF4446 family protein [Patescibacteria group bacterium]|nr:DUF4446 family protein [Patescibacteria group bacterium]
MSEIINTINNNQEIIARIGILTIALFLILNIYLSLSFRKIKKRTKSFFAGKEAKDLEEILYTQIKNSDRINEKMSKICTENKEIKENMQKCIQKVGVVRFNPFGDVGGNQSFTIALLDNYLSGVIILSLYSREGVKVYSKQIIEGKCEYKLSEEEEEAIKIAMN